MNKANTQAAIDIGSNSILLTVISDEGVILHDEATVVSLGRGLGDQGVFLPDRMQCAQETLEQYLRTCETFGILPHQIRAVATSASRRAINAVDWFQQINTQTGLCIQIISGDREAQLAWAGACHGLEIKDTPRLVIDLGGGSTEWIYGNHVGIDYRKSLEFGSVRMTEAFFIPKGSQAYTTAHPDSVLALEQYIKDQLPPVPVAHDPIIAIGVAGTVTSLSAMMQALKQYDSKRIHGSTLPLSRLKHLIQQLTLADPSQRRALSPTSPERADYLLAGAIILKVILEACQLKAYTVSERGIRFGLLCPQ